MALYIAEASGAGKGHLLKEQIVCLYQRIIHDQKQSGFMYIHGLQLSQLCARLFKGEVKKMEKLVVWLISVYTSSDASL